MKLTVYLSGEIHTNWRDEIKQGAVARGLDIEFTSAMTDHEATVPRWANLTLPCMTTPLFIPLKRLMAVLWRGPQPMNKWLRCW
jgi:hypothetical protein